MGTEQVRVRLSADGARVRIEVDDDGPGIAPEQRALALQRGQRLDERRSGSGLGLAIVDELARLHGGTLDAGRRRPGRPARRAVAAGRLRHSRIRA